MKNKSENEFDIERSNYELKIQDIKKRKRMLHLIDEPSLKKKIRKELKSEQRSAKHSDKNNCKKYIKEQINIYKNT